MVGFVRYDGIEKDIDILQGLKQISDITQMMHGPNASPNVTEDQKQALQRLINSMVAGGHYIPIKMANYMRQEGFTFPEGSVVK